MLFEESKSFEKFIANVSVLLAAMVFLALSPMVMAFLAVIGVLAGFLACICIPICFIMYFTAVFCLGVLLHSTRLAVVTDVFRWYATLWGKSENGIRHYILDDELPIAVGLWHRTIVLEIVFEGCPSIIINMINMSMVQFTPIGITSMVFTVYMLTRTTYKYVYEVLVKHKSLNDVSFELRTKPDVVKEAGTSVVELAGGIAASVP